MYKNILIPIATDHSHAAESIELARALSAKGAKITALTVVEEIPGYVAQYLPEGQLAKTGEAAMNALKADVGEDIDAHVVSGHSGRTIVDYADDNKIDLIIIASHRPGLQDYFLGSTAARVVRHAQCAVHVMR